MIDNDTRHETDPPDAGRRDLLTGLGALGAGAALGLGGSTATASASQHTMHMRTTAGGPPRKIALLVYPRMVALDLIVPMTILNILGADIHTVWKDRSPVATGIGLPIAA